MSKQGKKKTFKVMSLGEFHSATPLPQQETAPTQPSLNWADEMEKLDDSKPIDFTFDRSQLPTATKAALEPDIDLSQVPTKHPFTAHLSNISFEADEAKIRSFFAACQILNLRLPTDDRGTFKGHGYIDFQDRESLIAALKKNGGSFCNRPIRVQLESEQKKHLQRQGRGDYTTELRSDEADWRRPQQVEEPTRSYGEQRGGQRGGYGQQQQRRGGHQQGYQQGYQQRDNNRDYNRDNNRDYNRDHNRDQNRDNYQSQGFQQQRRPYQSVNRPHRASENVDQSETQSVSSANSTPTTSMTERPKLLLAPRTKPVEETAVEGGEKASSSIFGSAKPVNTAAREREIEEKLKKDRQEAERLEKEKREKEAEAPKHEQEHTEEPASQDSDFQVVGSSGKPRYQNKNDNNNNTIRNQNRPATVTSPQQRYNKKPEYQPVTQPTEAPKENPWKTKSSAAELFNKEPSQPPVAEASDVPQRFTRPQGDDNRRSYPAKRNDTQNRDRPNRDGNNRDNKDRRFSDRNKPMNKNPRGDVKSSSEVKPVRPRTENFAEQPNTKKNEFGYVNKFSNLQIDVEDVEVMGSDEE